MFEIDHCELSNEMLLEPVRGRWWNSKSNINGIEPYRATLPKFVIIKDETLREGLTVPGRNTLSRNELVEIGVELEEAGFREIEVGYTAAIDEHRAFAIDLKKRTKLRQSAHTRTWAPDWKAEIDGVIDAGADIVNLAGFGTSETERIVQPDLPKEALPDLFAEQIAYARRQGAFTSFHISTNVTRPDIVERTYKLAALAGVGRANVADGYGVSTPEGTRFLINQIRTFVGPDVEIGLHAHNDFGLATANSLAAITAGATMIDASINGIGDRAGIVNSVQLVAALESLYDIRTGIDLARLAQLSANISERFGVPRLRHEPVVGDNMYRHETDIHIAALLSGNWFAYNVIRPDVLGARTELQFGPASLAKGPRSSVGIKIALLGLEPTADQIERIFAAMRCAIAEGPGFISEDQLESIIRETIEKH